MLVTLLLRQLLRQMVVTHTHRVRVSQVAFALRSRTQTRRLALWAVSSTFGQHTDRSRLTLPSCQVPSHHYSIQPTLHAVPTRRPLLSTTAQSSTPTTTIHSRFCHSSSLFASCLWFCPCFKMRVQPVAHCPVTPLTTTHSLVALSLGLSHLSR